MLPGTGPFSFLLALERGQVIQRFRTSLSLSDSGGDRQEV